MGRKRLAVELANCAQPPQERIRREARVAVQLSPSNHTAMPRWIPRKSTPAGISASRSVPIEYGPIQFVTYLTVYAGD